MHFKTRSPLFTYISLFGFVLLLFLLMRLVFWHTALETLPELYTKDTLRAFYIGARFDARLAALATIPVGFLFSIPFFATRVRTFPKLIFLGWFFVFFTLITLYALDYSFHTYLGVRLNSTLLELMEDIAVSMEMVWQSYPIVRISMGVVVVTLLCAYACTRLTLRPVQPAASTGRRVVGWFFGFILFAIAVYGQLSSNFFPLRWSHAYFSTSPDVIALALNPVQNLYDTFSPPSSGSYSLEGTKKAYPAMAAYFQVDAPDEATLSFERNVAGQDKKRPNIVIILMESLAYPKTSFAPGDADTTPALRHLAQESMLFTRFFANARTTARAVFTIMTGIPDVNESGTASRNPFVVDQHIVGNEFTDYKKFYMIGGNTSWANIRAVLGRNLDNLTIMEESAWKSRNVDVWGISDYDLLSEAHAVFAAQPQDKPFLALVQTASFHKPYTVPPTPGFSFLKLDAATAEHYGFVSEEEYNSLRYADFSVGEFIKKAKESPYYENTIFFIFGDHGLNDPSPNMPAGYNACGIAPWHVPLLIHAAPSLGLADRVQPGGVSAVPASHVDIFPTAAGLAGIPYRNRTLGRDIFDPRFDAGRAAYIGGKRKDAMRLVSGRYCLYDNRTQIQALYAWDDPEGTDKKREQPELFENMWEFTKNLDETARYMLFNNKRTAKGQKNFGK